MVQGYNFPDDATEEEIKAALGSIRASAPERKPIANLPPPPEEMGWGEYGKGLARSAASGLTFNFSDEGIAATRAASEGIPYEQALQEEREALKKFRDQYPVAALGSEVAGSLPTMFIPGMGPAKIAAKVGKFAEPFVQAAIVGAKQGVPGGFGSGEGDVVNRLESSAEGGATAALLGPVLTGAGRIASPMIRGVAERLMPGRYSGDVAKMKVLQDLERSKMTPADAQAEFNTMQAAGAPANYFDVSPSLTSRAETIAQRPGAAGEAITEEAINRQQGQRSRLMQEAKEKLGVTESFYDSADNAAEALRKNAKPLYDAAYQAKIPPQAQYDLNVVMDDVRKAFPDAESYAERLYLAERRKGFKETGTQNLTSPDFKGLPEVRQWDYIMRGLGQAIEKETDATTGKVTQLGRSATMLKNEIASVLDKNIPEFAAARAQYKGDIEVKNALETARKEFLRADPEELQIAWKGMSDAEKQAYRAGALKSIRDKLFGSADYTDATKRIGQAVQDRREALNIIMPNNANAKLFQDYLEAEAKLATNAQRIKGGSPTARRLEGAKDLNAGPDFTALGVAKDVATGKPGAALTRVFNFLAQNPAIPEARANAIGEMLRSGTARDVDRVTKSLEAYAAEQAAKETRRRMIEAQASKVTGRVVGGRMADNSEQATELPPLTIRRGP